MSNIYKNIWQDEHIRNRVPKIRGLKFDGKFISEKTNHIFHPLETKGKSRAQVQE